MSAAPIPSAPADLELIAQLRNRLQYAELKILVLEEQLRLMRIEKYGASGEKLFHGQMELFALEPVVSELIVPAESERAPVRRSTNRSCKHPGRQELPANLPRVERILPCTPDQRVCKRCGKETVVIGYEESSQLDVEPAKYFVLVTKREKRACRSCEEARSSLSSAATTDHREVPGERPHRHRHGHRQILQSHAPTSAEHDSGKRPRLGNQPSDAGRLGPESRRVADPYGRRDEARVD